MSQPNDEYDFKLFQLSELLDGHLSEQEEANLIHEVEKNERLAAEFKALSRTDELLSANVVDVPQLDWERFTWQARLRRETIGHNRVQRVLAKSRKPLAAAACIILAASVWFHREQSTPPVSSSAAAVQVLRTALSSATSVAIVTVTQLPPNHAPAIVDQTPKGKSLVVAIGTEPASAGDDADTEALF